MCLACFSFFEGLLFEKVIDDLIWYYNEINSKHKTGSYS